MAKTTLGGIGVPFGNGMRDGKLEWQKNCKKIANPRVFVIFCYSCNLVVYKDLPFVCHFKTLVVLVVKQCAILLPFWILRMSQHHRGCQAEFLLYVDGWCWVFLVVGPLHRATKNYY